MSNGKCVEDLDSKTKVDNKDPCIVPLNTEQMKNLNIGNILSFEWDKGNLEHIKKHHVEFLESEEVFRDQPIYFRDENHSLEEDKYLAYGFTEDSRGLTVIFTFRKDKIRVISARDQNKKEKEVYELNESEVN
jgi:uncharacterized protein